MKKIFFAAAVFTTLFTSCLKNDCSTTLTVHQSNQANELFVYVNGHKHKLQKGKYLTIKKDDIVKVGYYGKEFYNFPDCNEYRILQYGGETYMMPANIENYMK